ncbi:MAG: neuraminidase [Pedobacter sp.]|nr:MAG: neuraminidase [Pedobacter sp.]
MTLDFAKTCFRFFLATYLLTSVIFSSSFAQEFRNVKLVPVVKAWSQNSVNTTVFRRDPITTFKNTQYIAFYDSLANVVVGKRKLGGDQWELKTTVFKGKAKDAHNGISIITDGDGYLHMAWDHHGNPLRYSKSTTPGGLNFSDKLEMSGLKEVNVTYPQFFKMPNGNLLFLYRDGSSGSGDLVMNHYDTKTKKWTQRQQNLIDGNKKRNAYWQMNLDEKGTIHLSWVWREGPDVATNHDLAYARSRDGGLTWEKTSGEKYQLPMNAENAEYAFKIPENSELINQTSITADKNGNPFIATYWRSQDSKIPQYRLVYYSDGQWKMQEITKRTQAFSLSGKGTKKIPIARPQVVIQKNGNPLVIFRDEERGFKVSAAICGDLKQSTWRIVDLADLNVGEWEPSYDTELWKARKKMNLYVQNVSQADGEGIAKVAQQMVYVLEWKP